MDKKNQILCTFIENLHLLFCLAAFLKLATLIYYTIPRELKYELPQWEYEKLTKLFHIYNNSQEIGNRKIEINTSKL